MNYFFTFTLTLTFTTMEAQVTEKLRGLADTVGFAHKKEQMDSVMSRIEKEFGTKIASIHKEKKITKERSWRVAISPHDDYTYASYMYPLVLKNIHAKTVILFGVAHRAKELHLEDHLIFDSFTHWRGCYGNVKPSALREKIIGKLPKDIYQVNDTMQNMEHSVEAIVPFLQYYNKDVEIVSILVPYMSYERMEMLAKPLAGAIAAVMTEKKLQWGKDVAIAISTDAVHYGDEGWKGKNFAFFGADTAGYGKAVEYEHKIISDCFEGPVTTAKAKLFTEYTVHKNDYKEYKWTWCGRYSVPVGLLTAFYLANDLKARPLNGIPLGYSNSLDHPHVKVDDLEGMGVTAPAGIRHWVGYAGIGFE